LESRRLLSAAPLAPDLVGASDSGASSTDNITRFDNGTAATALQFVVGGTTADAEVNVYVDGTLAGTATGSGSVVTVAIDPTVKLAEGVHEVTARQTDPGGAESDPSPDLSLTVDVTAPAAPPAPDLLPTSDTGVSNSDDLTNDNTPTFAVAGAPYFRLLRDGVLLSGPRETGTSYTAPALADGTWAFTVQAEDVAGNPSPASPALQVTTDTTRPAASIQAPVPLPARGDSNYRFTVVYTDARGVDGTSIDSLDVRLAGPNSYNQQAVLESATSEAGGTRRLATYRALAPGGSWDSADNGVYAFNLQASQVRDLAGNVNGTGAITTMTVRLFGPTTVPDLSTASDTGASDADNVTRIDNGPARGGLTFVVGNTFAGAVVTLYADGTPIGSAVATGTTTTVVTSGDLPLASGYYAITALQTLAGEAPVAASPALGLVIDTVPPPVPARPDLQSASDSGVSDSDDLTNDNTPTFDLFLVLSPYYEVAVDGLLKARGAVPGPSFTSAPLADGAHTITVRAGDLAGNLSEPSEPLPFTIDTVAPGQTSYAGTLDASFDGDGVYTSTADPIWTSAAVQSDGKVLLAGPNGLTRLNADGSRDRDFGSNGTVPVGGPNVAHVSVQPDGQIVLGGQTKVWRISARGEVDGGFGGTGAASVDFLIRDVAAAADGKALVVGALDDDPQVRIVRLNPDGSRDDTFGTGGKLVVAPTAAIPNTYPMSVFGMADGRVLVAGYTNIPDGKGDFTYQSVVLRFNADGTPDTTFNGTGRLLLKLQVRSEASSVEVLPDGRILLSGHVATSDVSQTDAAYLARLTPAGALDPSFDGDGVQTTPGFRGFGGSLSDGSYFLATSAFGGIGFVRYDAGGRPDPEPGGMNVSAILPGQGFSPSNVAVGPDDKVVVVGTGVGVFPPAAAARLDTRTFGVLDLRAASDSGRSSTDDLTRDTTPTLDLVAPPAEAGVSLRLYLNGVRVAGAFDESGSYTSEPLADGVWRFTTALVDAAGNEAMGATLPVTVDTTAPTLQSVRAFGLVWQDPFFIGLQKTDPASGADGVLLPTTAGSLPWGMVNRLTLVFDEPVNVGLNDLHAVATPGVVPAFSDFEPVGRTTGGIWTFSRNLPATRLVFTLADTVTDAAGNRPAGGAGGPFEYRLNILVGDGDRDGRVGPRDLAQVRTRLNTSSSSTAPFGARSYNAWFDFNADGKITLTDYKIVRSRLLTTLPPAPPPAPAVQAVTPARSAYRPVRAGVLTDERGVTP
jgi:uncharacterized delta-60 repeat protein